MSENVVHTSVVQDSFALGQHYDAILPEFKQIMKKYEGFSLLGCITIAGDKFSFRLLEQFKAEWKDRKPQDAVEHRLAYVLGWISHRACDRVMKPIWREPPGSGRGSNVDPSLSPTECSVYHEGYMLMKYFSNDPGYAPAIFADKLEALNPSGHVDAGVLEETVRAAMLLKLMEIQTVDKPGVHSSEIVEELEFRKQEYYVDLQRYVQSSRYPQPEKTAEYLTDIRWFDESDPIVSLALTLRRGEEVPSSAIDDAMKAEPVSYYGRALKLSLGYIVAAAEYLSTDMTTEILKDRLDIGKRGPNGLAV